jgi:hypothetical protein
LQTPKPAFEPVEYSVHTPRQKANMGKSKMDEAAAERIRRARGDKVCCSSLVTCQNIRSQSPCSHCGCTQDGFSKRAADAARRNEQGGSSSSSKSSSDHNSKSGGGHKSSSRGGGGGGGGKK